MMSFFKTHMDRMPNSSFKRMSFIFKIRDLFFDIDKILDEFGICKGHVVVDYGCGPGSYLKKASELVGDTGKVFAVDLHELAVESVKKRIKKEELNNVAAVFAPNGNCSLDHKISDVIYALDMFHMVSDSDSFLKTLNNISKPEGFLFIDNGHQPREQAKDKINSSGVWEIVKENRLYMQCRPIN